MLTEVRRKHIIMFFCIGCMSFIFNVAIGEVCFRKMGEMENWKRYIQIFRENKLPLLGKEQEDEILRETERILREEKSLFLAYLYLVKTVGDYENGYLLYGNERIKKKLVELMKMRVQCVLKRSLRDAKELMDAQSDDERGNKWKKEAMTNMNIFEKQLKKLIEKEGDLCKECYLDDEGEEKRKLAAGDDEGLPGGYSWDIALLYSVTLSCFSGELYEYLWVGSDVFCAPTVFDFHYMRDAYAMCVSFATIYASQFLEDLEKGYLKKYYMGYKICKDEGEAISMYEVLAVIKAMIFFNSGFVKQEKQRLKSILFFHANKMIEKQYSDLPKILGEKSIEEASKDPEKWAHLTYIYLNGVWIREKVLEIYEQIGEREDIENIKQLGEGIALDYPVRETNREFDEKRKEEYLQRVKSFQERVNALVGKLSRE